MSYHSDLCPDTFPSGLTPMGLSPGGPSPESVSVHLPEEEDVVPSRRERCFECCKKTTAFFFSTIGLTSMLIGYTIVGGFLFRHLEAPLEMAQSLKELAKNSEDTLTIRDSRLWHVQQLWNATLAMNIFYEKNWTDLADELLLNYSATIFNTTKMFDPDGTERVNDAQWTFAGAMLYSITVITTIGYGHIAPKTAWGQVVTIIYAMFGIPLCLLTLTNLGGFMATAFRFIYNNICCGLCCLCCDQQLKREAQVRAATLKYNDAGNGDPAAAESLTAVASPDSTMSKGSRSPKSPKSPRSPNRRKISTTVTWRSGLRRVLKTEDNKAVSVPISVSLMLIAGYILAGAVLFKFWEEWTFLESSYFCFITLTTIGFGDLVPGTNQEAWNNQQKLVLCCMYLIFGLALIAMCFDLMQEEVRNKVRYLAQKLGLTDKDKKQDNLDNAQKATQTTSPAPSKPSKSSSSTSVKNFTLSAPKPTKSRSKTSLNANNLESVPETEILTKKQKRERDKERKAAEKKEAAEKKQSDKDELEEQKMRAKKDEEDRKMREKQEKEDKKTEAKREKEQLLQNKRAREKEKKEKSKKDKHKKDKDNHETHSADPVYMPSQTYRSPEML